MTREEKMVEARRLRATGRTLDQVAEALSVSRSTVLRWTNPQTAEKNRVAARAWKARNPDRIRERQKVYAQRFRVSCSRCGHVFSFDRPSEVRRHEAAQGTQNDNCPGCRHKRAEQIVEWWAAGVSLREIARRLGWTKNQISVEFHRLREKGYSLPYRYRGKRNGQKFPEQQVAA